MGILKNLKEVFEVIKEKEVFESSPTVPTGFELKHIAKMLEKHFSKMESKFM